MNYDARAFAALMAHLAEFDADDRTVIMVRVENSQMIFGRSLNGDERNQTGIGTMPAAVSLSLYRH